MIRVPQSFKIKVTVLALCALLVASGGETHDYWLSPDQGILAVGDRLSIQLLVGDRLESEVERPLQKEITTRYEWVSDNGTIDLLEALPDSAQPVFNQVIQTEGTSLVLMDRDYYLIESTYERFRSFLAHEEQETIGEKVKDIPGEQALRRRYARNLKSLVCVGAGGGADLHDRTVGQKLEIILLQNPCDLGDDAELGIRVLFDGEPLEEALVRAFVGRDEALVAEMSERSDAAGLVHFRLGHEGLWVIRVSQVMESVDPETADWDTHYATFSFIHP